MEMSSNEPTCFYIHYICILKNITPTKIQQVQWWRRYSGLVFCKTRGNSGVTAYMSRHCMETAGTITVEMIPYCGQMSHGIQGLPCLGVV